MTTKNWVLGTSCPWIPHQSTDSHENFQIGYHFLIVSHSRIRFHLNLSTFWTVVLKVLSEKVFWDVSMLLNPSLMSPLIWKFPGFYFSWFHIYSRSFMNIGGHFVSLVCGIPLFWGLHPPPSPSQCISWFEVLIHFSYNLHVWLNLFRNRSSFFSNFKSEWGTPNPGPSSSQGNDYFLILKHWENIKDSEF